MNDSGFVYVPNSCANGVRCKIHVVFHGCKQTVEDIQDVYVKNAGYNAWAESNDIVILYPQIKHDAVVNPNGCWDWWGYTDSEYSTKNGVQMAAIRAMLKRLAGN